MPSSFSETSGNENENPNQKVALDYFTNINVVWCNDLKKWRGFTKEEYYKNLETISFPIPKKVVEMIKSRNIEYFTTDGDEDKKEYRIDELSIDNDERSEENDKIRTITVSLVDTQVDGGYFDMKFPIPGKFIDIIQDKYKTFNGFKIDDDPEQKTYDVSVIGLRPLSG